MVPYAQQCPSSHAEESCHHQDGRRLGVHTQCAYLLPRMHAFQHGPVQEPHGRLLTALFGTGALMCPASLSASMNYVSYTQDLLEGGVHVGREQNLTPPLCGRSLAQAKY